MKKIYTMLVLTATLLTLLVCSVSAGTIYVSADVVENTVVAQINFKDNPGMAGVSLRMDFDNTKLLPVSIEAGNAVGGLGLFSNIQLVDDLSTLKNVTAVNINSTDMKKDGVFCTVVFSIKSGATGNTTLRLYVDSEQDLINQNVEPVQMTLQSATITLPGNGNSAVIVPPVVDDENDEEPEEEPFVPTKIFADVNEADWYFGDVAFVYDKGLMKGTAEIPELIFSPALYTNRAMFVTVLYRMEGQPAAGECTFEDVPEGEYYEKAVAWAAENGIVNGISATEFAPMADITREQTAKIIANYAKYKKVKIPDTQIKIDSFGDYSSVSDWAVESMQICADMNIIRGYDDNTIKPQGNTTRAETAAILRRVVDYMNNSK